jgi:hypothetical protein
MVSRLITKDYNSIYPVRCQTSLPINGDGQVVYPRALATNTSLGMLIRELRVIFLFADKKTK